MLIKQLLALKESSNSDSISRKAEQIVKGIISGRPDLTADEVDNGASEKSDIEIFKYIAKKSIEGISNLKAEKQEDDGAGEVGYAITFSAGGKNYYGSWWPEAGRCSFSIDV